MICRYWRGWTTHANASPYETLLRGEVIPGIEARGISGFRQIDVLRREDRDEVEFATMMWFDSAVAVKGFVGEDSTVSQVPAAARELLSRFDERAVHYDTLERRPQSG